MFPVHKSSFTKSFVIICCSILLNFKLFWVLANNKKWRQNPSSLIFFFHRPSKQRRKLLPKYKLQAAKKKLLCKHKNKFPLICYHSVGGRAFNKVRQQSGWSFWVEKLFNEKAIKEATDLMNLFDFFFNCTQKKIFEGKTLAVMKKGKTLQ